MNDLLKKLNEYVDVEIRLINLIINVSIKACYLTIFKLICTNIVARTSFCYNITTKDNDIIKFSYQEPIFSLSFNDFCQDVNLDIGDNRLNMIKAFTI